jgi:hypothetical protein
MASMMFADQETNEMAVVGPAPVWKAGAVNAIEAGVRTRVPTRPASIAPIEALLDKVDGPVLANLWQQIRHQHVDRLPDRQAMISDLADFAEVLQPPLNDMQAPQLCRLIEAYAAKRRRSLKFLRDLLALEVNAGKNRAVADYQPGARSEHRIIDVASVAI